ncbi:hypothetical protein IQ265_10020 [Nodosilinea sp. LEGE 06152]|uniref:hypothetical protein n=1 Tax=Nodosilinea sp. LEGE 06152 TaxID=2777966 RepID=UPI0018829033|nr:hypothetical protein [Nodosilinea sp. LEGE 06152]MBE9157158.1 hypothetical protein [Nodosilinea sp. LEGE 06152]
MMWCLQSISVGGGCEQSLPQGAPMAGRVDQTAALLNLETGDALVFRDAIAAS